MSFEFMLKEINSFEETKNLKLDFIDVSTVYQYVKLKKQFNPDDPTHEYEPVLKFDPIRIEYMPSKAYQQKLDEQSKLKHINTVFHNDYTLEAKLDDFEILNDERQKALNKVLEFIENFEKKSFMKGLYIYGQNRTGKTFLLSAIANELSNKNIDIFFTYVPDLIRNIHNSMEDNTIEYKVKQLKNCDLLILDDLGSAFMSTWFRDQIFGPVIQYRLSVGLPVLISSNLSLQQLGTFLVDPKVENDKYNAVRIIKRIEELTTPIHLSEIRYKKIG